MSMRKSRLSLYRTACLLLMLTLVISSAGPASAQLPGTGGESSQQPYSGESPTTDSPWGAPSTSTQLSMLSNTDKQYVAATWTDNAVHFLDGSLNNTGSFAIGNTQPNGIATDGVIIYVGIFNMSSVRAFDYAGNLLNSWSDARLDSVQGLELVDGTLAAYESDTNQIHFYNPSTGVYLRSIPGEPSTEGLAYDGVLLWQLSSSIVGISPADGTVVRSIPNAGSGCDFEGSALSADGSGKLVIGCSNGNWYRVSSLDGAVLASGNNGLQMFGLGRSPIAQIHAAYMRSTVGPPWGVNTNETAMSRVFEAGHWQDLRYETVNPAILFSPSTNLIFMEGSDTNANELEAFLATHQDLLETWVAEGGCLLLNAAPNEGNGMSFGFGGVNLTYPAFSLTGVAPNPAHPIFNGPFLPAGSSYTGEWFSHGSVSGGDITALLSGDNSTVPLAEKDWGFGQVVFGGMPTTNFHYPQPNATNLRANILYYLTTFGCEINAAPVAGDDGDVFYEDFESGYASWTMTGLWNPENQFDVCGNSVKPFASPFNAAYFGVDGICNYNTGQVVTGALTLDSPISLPANSSPRLVFSSYEETEDVCDVWDFRYVEISTDGGSSWNLLDHLCNEGTWIMYDFDLSAYAGENILLRFRFDSIDADSNGFFGWMVDNIAVRYTPFNFLTDEDSPFITPNVLANDSDRYGDPLIVDSYDTSGLLGTLNYNNNGTFTYDPVGAFESLAPGEQTLETFSYVTSDGVHTDTAHVYIVVTGVNDTPEAVNDSFSTPEDLILNQAAPGVLGNDSDPEGDAITAVLVQPPAVGSLTQNPNGSFNYTPAANYNGVVNYTYAASDGVLMSSLKPVDVRFDEPEFPLNTVVNGYVTDSLYGYAIPPLGFSFMVNGVPSNSAKFANIGPESAAYIKMPDIEGPTIGTLYINFGADVSYASFGFVVNLQSPTTDAVTVTAYDASQAQVAVVEADGIDTGYLFAENRVEINPGVLFRSLKIDFTDAALRFVVDNLLYNLYTGPAEVGITVNAVNDAPVAVNDSYSPNEDTPLIIDAPGVLDNDTDVDGNALTAVVNTAPTHGTLTLNPNGSFQYTPALNYNGLDSFTYHANDGQANSNIATVNITINSINDAPVAMNDSYSTNEGTPLIIDTPGVLGNDSDAEGDSLQAILVSGVSHGVLALNEDGSFTYTPTANFVGIDSFTYKANDGNLDSLPATVTITVGSVIEKIYLPVIVR